MRYNKKSVIGWIGVFITLIFSSIWAYWGSMENFHEGWYSDSLWENLFMLVFQYLLFTIVFVSLAVVTLRWKRFGFIMHFVLAAFAAWFFSGASFSVLGLLIVIPLGGLGLLYYFGEPEPKKLAYRLIIGIPVIIILGISIPYGIRVSHRVNDNDFGLRVVEGNGVTLAWAPRGPGWPDRGVSWEEAMNVCKYLSEDGSSVMEDEQNIWRLPTVDEAVRSMTIHGENAGGVWYPEKEKAVYDRMPDKETPLWDVRSKIVYYWTSESSIRDDKQAYIIVYHGGIFDKRKKNRQSYQSFRAVKEVQNRK